MKKWILVLMVLSLNANAGEWSAHAMQMSRITDEDYFMTGGWEGVQINYQTGNNYTFFGYEEMSVMPKGRAWEYTLIGLGVGSKYNLTENIRLFGQIGYYHIKNSWGARRRERNEALNYYFNDRWYGSTYEQVTTGQHVVFDEWSVENDNTFAGTIGIEMIRPITKNLNMSFVFSYRQMKIKEKIMGFRDVWDESKGYWWEIDLRRDYSTTNFGVGVNYQF